MNGSLADYNGNGDTLEGIGEEIQGLQEMAMEAMQAYATEVAGTDIAYVAEQPIRTSSSIPTATARWTRTKRPAPTVSRPSRRRCWKPPTTISSSIKDPGAFAHNPKYIIELLYDSIDSLNPVAEQPIDLTDAQPRRRGTLQHHGRTVPSLGQRRRSPGDLLEVPSAGGLPFYLENGVNMPSQRRRSRWPARPATTWRTTSKPARLTEVTFPSGATGQLR